MLLRRGLHSVAAAKQVSAFIEPFPFRFFACSSPRYYHESRIYPFPKPFNPDSLKLPLAKYGGRQTVTVLPGDGIGPEMLGHLKRVFRVAHVPVDFEDVQLDSQQAANNEDLENAIISIERNGVAIKGNIETKFEDLTLRSRNVELRVRLDLFANVLHCKSIPGIPARHKDIDIVLIRENMEGEYSGIEHETVPGVVESLKVVTRRGIERIAEFAFDYAAKYNRNKITAVHKANIMKIADGLFLKVCEDMAGQYKDVKFENMIIDNASMQMVQNPHQFDVILLPNLYGNIMGNVACGLVGGPGLISGSNIGSKYAIFETGTRNTGTALTGADAANPTAFLRAGVEMLYYLGLKEKAGVIEDAIMATLTKDRIRTADIGGTNRCSEVVDSVIQKLDKLNV